MIGPTSGTNNVPNREVSENSIRNKRKVFDDLDIENFCEDIYQGGRKRYMTEIQGSEGDLSEISASNFSSLSAEEAGSVARLEVLVVDGNWETCHLDQGNFEGINQTQIIQTNGQILTPLGVEFSNQNLGEVQHFWETPQIPQTPQLPLIKPSSSRASQIHRFQDNNQVEDQENGNLSWLLDFKLDSFIEAADDRTPFLSPRDHHLNQRSRMQMNNRCGPSTSFSQESRKNSENSYFGQQRDANSSFGSNFDNRNNLRQAGPKKPPFTYTELIEHALQEKGELTVSAIYQWISEHFPYYKSNDDRWKNSVRHNLSINPHFRKGSKAPHGAGHLWAIANQDELRSRHIVTNDYKQSILESICRKSDVTSQIITMDEVEAATASIAQPPEEEPEEIVNSVTLEHCAEQILSGIKREVEVQYLVPMTFAQNDQNSAHQNKSGQQGSAKETDFLNPVSKEVVAEECGLIGEGYLVTDLTPAALGLNIVDPDMITADNLFGEELSFQFYEFTSPSQVQSA